MGTPHLLLDFGEVISVAQPAADVSALAALAGLPVDAFSRLYWAHRPAYDAGGTARDYWTAIMGAAPGGSLLRRLVELDVASWLHLNQETLRLLDTVHAAGTPVSLLSNAPHDLARELDRHTGLAAFAHRIFSADLALVKPDAGIYSAALATLAAAPADVVFVDDRPVNIAAAEAHGIRGIVFTGTPGCLSEITAALSGPSDTRTVPGPRH
ncbi:HAD-IA family hydrolase [Actinoplanes friuliensis]|uniref:Hydrolase (HAD superfamily)-like protein n=1 Tax=Actinoplanes friuliensis DSM 7358 TaxID=1246995 RepID=U5VZH5_9ACTN|nr:HAD-IA family hydrolase [Actinoplanes friuliensis]AGZ42294.1 hydrolase (HAD superfamily)-like protein [Actinoplanes friuliensis DSM 7358]